LSSLRVCASLTSTTVRGWCLSAKPFSRCFTSSPFVARPERMATARCGWFAVVSLAVVVVWPWTVRSRVSKTVRTVISNSRSTGFATLEATWLSPCEATSEAPRLATRLATGCQRTVSIKGSISRNFTRSTNPPCSLRGKACFVQNGFPVANLGRTLHRISAVKTPATPRIKTG